MDKLAIIFLGSFLFLSFVYGQNEREERYINLEKQVRKLQEKLEEKELSEQEWQEKLGEIQRRVDFLEKENTTKEEQIKQLEEKKESSIEEEFPSWKERVSALEEMAEKIRAEESENDIRVFWKYGFRFQTADEQFSLAIGGRIILDFGFVHEDDAIADQLEKIEDFVRFRAARFKMSGTLYRDFIFGADFDFEGNVAFKDVFIGRKNLPLEGILRLGFIKEPLGLEEATSSNNITFLERASHRAFNPVRNIGMNYSGYWKEASTFFSFGVFREVADDDPPKVNDDSGAYSLGTRWAHLPWKDENSLVHLGIGYNFRNALNDEVRFRSRAEISDGPQLVDTGVIDDVEDVHILVPEFVWQWGSFSVQTEATFAWVRRKQEATRQFWGYYVYLSYFLSGEKRPYKDAAFGRIVPQENFSYGEEEETSWGAFELAARYSFIDLRDGEIDGRKLEDITLGVNWYLNPQMRIMLNYVYFLLNDLNDSQKTDGHAIALRFQLTF